jgi:hypothetical protein
LNQLYHIPDWPNYAVDINGGVWSFKYNEWRQLKPNWIGRDRDRATYTLYRDKKKCRQYGAHLVLLTFVGPCPDGMECCHNDGNPSNDSKGNLRWDTYEANEADKRLHGTYLYGESLHQTIIVNSDLEEIIDRQSSGESYANIAADFGVSVMTIWKICNGGRVIKA